MAYYRTSYWMGARYPSARAAQYSQRMETPVPTRTSRPKRSVRRALTNKGADHIIDVSATGQVMNSTGNVVLLNGASRGDDIADRTGRRTKNVYVGVRARGYVTATTGTAQEHRVLLVYDRQSNGAAPAVTDILLSASPNAFYNFNNTYRFKILYDRKYTLGSAVDGQGPSTWGIKVNRNIRLDTIFNNGNAGTIADMQTGGLFLVYVGSNAAGVTAGTIDYYCRVKFVDI